LRLSPVQWGTESAFRLGLFSNRQIDPPRISYEVTSVGLLSEWKRNGEIPNHGTAGVALGHRYARARPAAHDRVERIAGEPENSATVYLASGPDSALAPHGVDQFVAHGGLRNHVRAVFGISQVL